VTWQGPLQTAGEGVYEIPADYRGVDGKLRMRVPARIVADETLLMHMRDDLAPEQLANVASMPGIVGAAWAMPDMHWGYGFPIGGVAAFDPDEGGVVSPGGVGFDINCGVRLLRTGLTVAEVRPRLGELLDALFATVPAGLGGRGDARIKAGQLHTILEEGAAWAVDEGLLSAAERACLEEGGRLDGASREHVSERALERGRRTLGSLGSGNHFLEVQTVAETWPGAQQFGVAEGDVVVMLHTGSRGLGHQVAQDHLDALQADRYGIALPDRQLACAPLDSPEAERYLGAMAAAANFAFVNRSLLADRARRAVGSVFCDAEVETIYDVCHNIAKWEEHVVGGRRRRLLVHRKGATRAFGPGHPELPAAYRDAGQPVLVPGDMGRQSFLLAGRGAGAHGSSGGQTEPRAFSSCCHGAGRQMSRGAAKREWNGKRLVAELAAQGIQVRAVSPEVAAEEAPEAYKDVAEVVGAVERAGLAAAVARLKPLGVVKG
jgi:tRNA-splicing ligase RtcB (3'-phosphate/5'-hydroxy nucleic acid ligase)